MRGALGLAILHAVLMAFAYPERLGGVALNLWPLVFLVPVPLAYLAVEARRFRLALLSVLLASTVAWLGTHRWLASVTAAGWPLIALYMAAWPCLFVIAVRLLVRHPWTARLPLVLVIPVAWVALETVRGEFVWHGYPWYLLATPLVEMPILAQSADLFGVYGLSLLVALPAAVVVEGLRRADAPRLAWSAAAAVLLHLSNLSYGAWRLSAPPGRPGPTVLAIQTNLPQSNKVRWSLDAQERDVAGFLDQTRRAYAATGATADLVVWPETMLPVRGLEIETVRTLLDWNQTHELAFVDAVMDLTRDLGTPLLVGAPCHLDLRVVDDGTGPRWDWSRSFNSAYLVTGDPPYQRADKIHLTPFGEVIPYVSGWPWLQDKLLGVGAPGMSFTLSAAESVRRLTLPADGTVIATPICFEDTIPRVVRRQVWENGAKRVDLIINISNDGWFGTEVAGRVQHAQVARMRCIENRVPMIRCVNTGMTIAIDSSGRLVGAAGTSGEDPAADGAYGVARQDGWMLAPVTLDDRRPLVRLTGEGIGWLCVLLLAGAAAGMAFAGRFGRRKSLP